VAAEHPLALAAAQTTRSSPVHRRVPPAAASMEADLATQEKKGMPTGLHVRIR
jgi:leucyl-tRNA synthetase